MNESHLMAILAEEKGLELWINQDDDTNHIKGYRLCRENDDVVLECQDLCDIRNFLETL
jgi:hypothetical protein